MSFRLKQILLFSCFLCFLGQGIFALNTKEEDAILRDFAWQKFTQLPKDERQKIGVTLSAGALRGASHIGVMEVLSEAALPIDYMSGTSMGCIVGALYNAGLPLQHLQDLVNNIKTSFISRDFNIGGVLKYLFAEKLFSSEEFQEFIDKEVGSKNYEDLPIPFACVSADIKTGEKVVFDSGPLSLGVRASMNLPGVFEPVEYRQRLLVDGGIVDYMPVDLVKKMGADFIIAVYALPSFAGSKPSNIMGYVLRIGDLRGAVLTEDSENQANFVILSRVGEIGSSDRSKTNLAIEIGASSAYQALPQLKEKLIINGVNYVFK
ncbi:MAG: patatin-like phospholipase family protein [Elusimicrobiaceae bacterium]|nr:patatin-like phospholipase family protein [Elusimicrobiaceae bacterium]